MNTPEASDTTQAYYDANAEEFAERTLKLDMEALYRPFLSLLQCGASILDAGCGPGRDLNTFAERGFGTVGIDASKEMVRLARENSGQEVRQMRFQDVAWKSEFDGIWACASLLHVPKAELPNVLANLGDALKPRGVLAISFKYGTGERLENGRLFSDLDEKQLQDLLEKVPQLNLIRSWSTSDARPDRRERWLNALLRRSG